MERFQKPSKVSEGKIEWGKKKNLLKKIEFSISKFIPNLEKFDFNLVITSSADLFIRSQILSILYKSLKELDNLHYQSPLYRLPLFQMVNMEQYAVLKALLKFKRILFAILFFPYPSSFPANTSSL